MQPSSAATTTLQQSASLPYLTHMFTLNLFHGLGYLFFSGCAEYSLR
jgi:hypothetical protein